MMKKTRTLEAGGALLLAFFLFAAPLAAQPATGEAEVGIVEKLGDFIPMDLVFNDEEGNPVILGSLIDRPTVLTLVYFRCPSICSPLMHELAAKLDELDLEPGIDFNLITVSFDDNETHELASTAKRNLLNGIERKVPPESWRFLTGKADAIAALTEAVGFRYKKEKQDFVHAGTVIFLSKEGKIVRYLPGLQILAANMKMAILDAAEGKPRSFMQQLQRLCYAYDPEGKTYLFKVNRLILAVTLLFVALFALYLVVVKVRKRKVSEGKVSR